ncbi:MAG: hypothetical protein ACOCUU_02095 [Nanoarchaeota archaeon]
MSNKKNNLITTKTKKAMALSQVMILIIGIVAFAGIVGIFSMEGVRGEEVQIPEGYNVRHAGGNLYLAYDTSDKQIKDYDADSSDWKNSDINNDKFISYNPIEGETFTLNEDLNSGEEKSEEDSSEEGTNTETSITLTPVSEGVSTSNPPKTYSFDNDVKFKGSDDSEHTSTEIKVLSDGTQQAKVNGEWINIDDSKKIDIEQELLNRNAELSSDTSRIFKKDGKTYFIEKSGRPIEVEQLSEDYLKFKGDDTIIDSKGVRQEDITYSNGRIKDTSTGKIVADDANYAYDWSADWGNNRFTRGAGFALGHIAQGVVWAGMVYGSIQFLGMFFEDDKETFNTISESALIGIMAGKTAYGLISEGGLFHFSDKTVLGMGAKGWSTTIGIGVAAWYFYENYEKTKEKEVTMQFSCESWQAPTGGENCELCNEQANGALPCSEYQCKSLGQSCELVNPGTSESKCVWVSRKDATPPEITPWKDVLTKGHTYTPSNAVSPPDKGVQIVQEGSTTGCVKAFTPLEFGITTNEPAQCKIDFNRVGNYSDMQHYFGNSNLFTYNHSESMSLPGSSNLDSENLTIENDNDFTLYTRCMDANGNVNEANFVFKFCVEEGLDVTAPEIVTTDLISNEVPVAQNQSSLDLSVYTNEPADCRWSRRDQSYENMENPMTCSESITEYNSQMLYACSGVLTGIEDKQDNNFYFRCKDQPQAEEGQRNTNRESYEITIVGTRPLVISKANPSDTTIKGSTEDVKVTLNAETQAGYKDGKAKCYYSASGETESYNLFFETNSHKHSQDLYLSEGDYKFYIKCVDLGGNSDEEMIEFYVDSDTESPEITRFYHEESYLKFLTNENSSCVYGISDCNFQFEDGSSVTTLKNNEHYVDWNTDKSYYVKCQDKYGNTPAPDECSAIIRGMRL